MVKLQSQLPNRVFDGVRIMGDVGVRRIDHICSFPSAIPSTTKVPRWAYLDVSVGSLACNGRILGSNTLQTWDGFNITAARLTAQGVYFLIEKNIRINSFR